VCNIKSFLKNAIFVTVHFLWPYPLDALLPQTILLSDVQITGTSMLQACHSSLVSSIQKSCSNNGWPLL